MDNRMPFTNSEIGESSEDAHKAARDESTRRFMASTHTDPYDVMPPGPDRQIPQTTEPEAGLKGKCKKKAGINDFDSDFRDDNLWPGANNLDSSGYLTSFPLRWQSGSTSFIARASEHYTPWEFFASPSPAQSTPVSLPPSGSSKASGNPRYVDRGCSPDPDINCSPYRRVTVFPNGSRAVVYKVHLKDHGELSQEPLSENQHLFHVITYPPYKCRPIYLSEIPTLSNFTKMVRYAFNMHSGISQITVYLSGKDEDGLPLEWKPIPIMDVQDWDGAMTVGQKWNCQMSVVVEFAPRRTGDVVCATTAENPVNEEDEAGPSKQASPQTHSPTSNEG